MISLIASFSAGLTRFCLAVAGFAVAGISAAESTSSPYRLSSAEADAWRYRPADPPVEPRAEAPPALRVDDRRPYSREIALAAQRSGLDPELVHAVIAVESAYQPAAISPKGAVGLMQVMPQTAQLYGVSNPANVAANLRAGTRHLSGLLERFGNRLDLALAAYNAGEGAVRRHNNSIPPYAETRSYVPSVVARYRVRRPEPIAASAPAPLPAAKTYLPGTRLELAADEP